MSFKSPFVCDLGYLKMLNISSSIPGRINPVKWKKILALMPSLEVKQPGI